MSAADVIERISSFEGLFTIGGIIIGGAWTYRLFVKNREGEAQAKVSHTVESHVLDRDHRFVRAVISVENRGKVKVAPPRFNTTVQYILPLTPKVEQLLESGVPVAEDEWEVEWDLGPEYDIKLPDDENWEIEPGETECQYLDFIIPMKVKLIQIHSRVFVKKESEEAWDDAILVKL